MITSLFPIVHLWISFLLAVILFPAAGRAATPDSETQKPPIVTLAQDKMAKMPIVVSEAAGPQTRAAASDLAMYLERITGAKFAIQAGVGTTGIAVGTMNDFQLPGISEGFSSVSPLRQDNYLLKTHPNGMYLIGASDGAVPLAVWDFLGRVGYRLYFPTDTWEVLRKETDLRVALNSYEQPDYVTRLAPRGAAWSDSTLWRRWLLRNRAASSFTLSTGHAYGGIIRRNAEAFAAHPEFFAEVQGRREMRKDVKFCIGNRDLRALVAEDAVRQVRSNPKVQSISVDPSDGGGWCECKECEALGSISDQAITLANEVAEAINSLGLGPKYVGIYAYNQHSPPPSINVHPKVIVSIATSFIRGGHDVNQLIEGWHARCETIGIREYHDVFAWSHDLPLRARGGDLDYLERTIPFFYHKGARFMNSEATDSWGANGLGFWITPRLLWDVGNANRIPELIEDFLQNAFGAAREPMREFYRILNQDPSIRAMRNDKDIVARLYQCLNKAVDMTVEPEVQARLDDLILYTRYVELVIHYQSQVDSERQEAFERLWRHVYRMKDRMMVSADAIGFKDRFRDPAISVPGEKNGTMKSGSHPWKESPPYTSREIREILQAGVSANPIRKLGFKPVEFSIDLIPAGRLKIPSVPRGHYPTSSRGSNKIYTWLSHRRLPIHLTVRGGLIPTYRDRGNVAFRLDAAEEATGEPVCVDNSVPPDGNSYDITLQSPYGGLHWLSWSDGSDRTQVEFPEDLPWTLRSTIFDPMRPDGSWTLYFYVPKGTKVIGGFSQASAGSIVNSKGKVVSNFGPGTKGAYFHVAVSKGEDGRLWKMANVRGACHLMTVPPYFTKSAEGLLLPREVVEGR